MSAVQRWSSRRSSLPTRTADGIAYDSAWLSGALGHDVLDPSFDRYEQQQNRSPAQVARELSLDVPPG